MAGAGQKVAAVLVSVCILALAAGCGSGDSLTLQEVKSMLGRLPDRYEYVDWPEASGESVAGRAIDSQGHVVEFAISWGSKGTEEGRRGPPFLRNDATGVAIDYSGGRWALQHEEVPHRLSYPRGSHFPLQIEQMLCHRTIHKGCGV